MEKRFEKDIPSIAESMIREGKRTEPEKLLKHFVSTMPTDWKPMTLSPTSINIAYWSMEEFINHAPDYDPNGNRKMVVWVTPSYSKAFYLLAFIYVEREDWPKAMMYIDQALDLEPDHPLILCEKAMILSRLAVHQEAHDLYIKGYGSRSWAPAPQRSRALRGAAIALIDLKRLEEAEDLLKMSLEIEPHNRVALKELGYIEDLRKGLKSTDEYDLY